MLVVSILPALSGLKSVHKRKFLQNALWVILVFYVHIRHALIESKSNDIILYLKIFI